MSAVVGLDCKLYRNTGTWGSPTWNEITTTIDATLNIELGEAMANNRSSTWELLIPTLKKGGIDFNITADTAIDDYDVLRDAAINRTLVNFAIADGAIATVGTQYFKADCYVVKWSRGEPLLEAATVDLSIKPGYSSNVPAFTTVSS